MNIKEETIIKYFDIVVKELKDVSLFSVNNILIENKHLEVNNREERDYFHDLCDKIKTFGISRGYFERNGDYGWLMLTEKGIYLKDSGKGYFDYNKSSNQKFDWSYNGITSYIKNNKVLGFILFSLFIIFLGFQFFNEGFQFLKGASEVKMNIEKVNDTSAKNFQETGSKKGILSSDLNNSLRPITIDSLKLPYLENVPILDKGIFLRYSYNNLVIGGVNIDSININARSYDGEPLEIREYDGKLELAITKQPYVELKYKASIYSIEIIGKHHSFYCILKKDIIPTLN